MIHNDVLEFYIIDFCVKNFKVYHEIHASYDIICKVSRPILMQ